MQIELTQQQREELVEMLTTAYSDLKSGVHHAMTTAVREDLHRREALVESILDKLGASLHIPR